MMTLQFAYGTAVFLVWNSIVFAEQAKVVDLNEDTWRIALNKEWMIEFYAPWCPACKNFAPAWRKLGEWSNDIGINTAQIDVTTSPALSGRFLVTALPTIFHVINGEFRQYRGPRDSDALISFIEEQKWKEIEPVSPWKHPDSVQMAIVSYFFKLSHYLKEVNNVMLIDYGMPPWLTYVLFAIVTILLGALLGLILVSIIDLIFPPVSQNSRKSFSQGQKNSTTATDEDARDVIDDDGETETSAAVLADKEDDEEDAQSTSGTDSDEDKKCEQPTSKTKQFKETSPETDIKNSSQISPGIRKRKPNKSH
ncbi:thioredoxin-related transmembrane protein 1 [Contarinia nasturtii]|uniref:thioredoxin-related transmembrane protein 1 n=1 Tax=Contarinia nasturtii TaxID=265458 RepID=UPI0012D49B21|nr:thioredoxin-related transmembrane protein 1 [Contarinia nasturtii]XP_031639134.1 thioredoxin-related transmembrane protein 1 [Contarinia nasturtii]